MSARQMTHSDYRRQANTGGTVVAWLVGLALLVALAVVVLGAVRDLAGSVFPEPEVAGCTVQRDPSGFGPVITSAGCQP